MTDGGRIAASDLNKEKKEFVALIQAGNPIPPMEDLLEMLPSQCVLPNVCYPITSRLTKHICYT
jgi:hypothetical protein